MEDLDNSSLREEDVRVNEGSTSLNFYPRLGADQRQSQESTHNLASLG